MLLVYPEYRRVYLPLDDWVNACVNSLTLTCQWASFVAQHSGDGMSFATLKDAARKWLIEHHRVFLETEEAETPHFIEDSEDFTDPVIDNLYWAIASMVFPRIGRGQAVVFDTHDHATGRVRILSDDHNELIRRLAGAPLNGSLTDMHDFLARYVRPIASPSVPPIPPPDVAMEEDAYEEDEEEDEENEPPAPVTPTRPPSVPPPVEVPPPRVRISSEAELFCLVAERLVEDGRLSVLDEEDLKDHTCPLSLCIFRDPVIASDGQVYERSHIERHIVTNGPTSPLTNARLDHHALYPVLAVRKAIVRLVWRTVGTAKEDRTTATLLAFLGLDAPPEPTLEPPPPAPEALSPQAPGAPQRSRIFADRLAYGRTSARPDIPPSVAQQATVMLARLEAQLTAEQLSVLRYRANVYPHSMLQAPGRSVPFADRWPGLHSAEGTEAAVGDLANLYPSSWVTQESTTVYRGLEDPIGPMHDGPMLPRSIMHDRPINMDGSMVQRFMQHLGAPIGVVEATSTDPSPGMEEVG